MFKAIGLVNRLRRLSELHMRAMPVIARVMVNLLRHLGKSQRILAERKSALPSVLAGVVSNVGRRDISYAIARAGQINAFLWRLTSPGVATILQGKTAGVHADNIRTS